MNDNNGWGASTVATKYIYERLGHVLSAESTSEMEQELSSLYDELAYNYKVDTGEPIGEGETAPATENK